MMLLEPMDAAFPQQRHEGLRAALVVEVAHPLVELGLRQFAGGRLLRRHVAHGHGNADDAMRVVHRVLPQRMDLGIDQPHVVQADEVHAIRDVGHPQAFESLEDLAIVLERIHLRGHERRAGTQLFHVLRRQRVAAKDGPGGGRHTHQTTCRKRTIRHEIPPST
jgi:hypothetical protein